MGDTSSGAPERTESDQGDPSRPAGRTGSTFSRWLSRLTGREQTNPQTKIEEVQGAPGTGEMLSNVLNMRDVRVEDVSIPRPDIVAVADDASLDDVIEIFRSSRNTRLPVFTETLDTPRGFIHLKDVALQHGFGKSDSFDIAKMTRNLLYAPPSMRISALLQKMQTERVHMALVIDEYGGVDGLVTIEDLVEQIVGEIVDEHDTEEDQGWVAESPGIYRAIARTSLEEFESMAGVDLLPDELDEEVDTLGGLVFQLAGRVPLRGEVVKHPSGHEFEVVDADPRKIKRLRVRLDGATALEQAAE